MNRPPLSFRPIFRSAAAIALVIGLSMSATAQDMAPEFGAEPASPMAGMFSNLNPANWKMPNFKSMLPGQEEKARIVEKKDGLFAEVKKSASTSWAKTKEVFNPQKLNPVNFFPASSRTESIDEEPKPGFFRSLFTPAPAQEPQTETVQDFLKQSRPN
ncbi:hypothetical protein Poly51_20720 [Rubripirellula tenax]|uniref:Uncharacterized protein n=1 Tax=Rubripirellula tenax TaxID=2528015 RepID=A0A5C6FCY4_9BACT|nr:hypothetical protein [Rubripirellula tenax]TWU59285.1 hypothetical protein Poly51_20720 [Rubripirellula tenax]